MAVSGRVSARSRSVYGGRTLSRSGGPRDTGVGRVRADTDSGIWSVDRRQYDAILKNNGSRKR